MEDSESKSTLKSDISDKENTLYTLNEQIQKTKLRIQDLKSKISVKETEILRFENANKMFKYLQLSSLANISIPHQNNSELDTASESTNKSESDSELTQEYRDILDEKRNQIPPLFTQVDNLEKEQNHYDEIIQDLRYECQELDKDSIELKEEIRITNLESSKIHDEIVFTKKQIKDRQREIKTLENLKSEVDNTLMKLNDHEISLENAENGRLYYLKEINSLITQTNLINTQINDLQQKIDDRKADEKQLKVKEIQESQKFDSLINWQTERADLKAELKQLTDAIRKKKESISATEKELTKLQYDYEKYAPLVEKWRGRGGDVEIPEESITELWQKLENEKKNAEKKRIADEREMYELISNNSRLEEEITRKRNSLKRLTEQFQSEGNQIKKSMKEKQNSFENEEKKLLQQIMEIRLKIAQKEIQNV